MRLPLGPLTAAAAAAVVMLLAGCSGAPATGGTPSSAGGGASAVASAPSAAPASSAPAAQVPADSCSPLSADEASKAYGSAMTEIEGGGTSCSYSGPDGGFLASYSADGEVGWKIALLGLETAGKPAPIAGIGDRAAGINGKIAFQKGSLVVMITSPFSDSATEAPKMSAVAKAIAANV